MFLRLCRVGAAISLFVGLGTGGCASNNGNKPGDTGAAPAHASTTAQPAQTNTSTRPAEVSPPTRPVASSDEPARPSRGAMRVRFGIKPGNYDVVIARSGTTTFVYGPTEVQMAGNGIYTIVAVPTAQTTKADVLLLDDFVP